VKRILCAGTAITAAFLAGSATAQEAGEGGARASVTLLYNALSAEPGKDVAGLLMRATSPEWLSCGANDVCAPRDTVIAAIAGRHRSIPDLKWEIRDVLFSGNRVIVRGEATGTPAGEFMGVPYGGKSFDIMSIDIHTIEGGKIARSFHIEDWMGAARQLSAR
jgi:predicted ester cyclase